MSRLRELNLKLLNIEKSILYYHYFIPWSGISFFRNEINTGLHRPAGHDKTYSRKDGNHQPDKWHT